MIQIFKSLLIGIFLAGNVYGAGFLSPEKAFVTEIVQTNEEIVFQLQVAENIYLYNNKIHVNLTKPIKQDLTDKIQFPDTQNYHDEKVHWGFFELSIPYDLIKKYVKSGEYSIEVGWQGCSTQGLCYQPMKKSIDLTFGGKSELVKDAKDQAQNEIKNTQNTHNTQSSQSSNQELSEQDLIAKNLASGNTLWILITFFGFGLLLSLTPCIFPMIPILSSIIVSQSGDKMSVKKGFTLSFIYVFSMSLAYAIAGVLAGLFGANLQTALQNPYVLLTFSGIFILLALSMFGFYDIQLPKSLQNMANKESEKMKGKGFIGVGVMGFLSALIVGPCVAAPLAGALIYISQSGDAVLGGIALFVMSIGMGVPLLIIGASAGKLLPKPGMWMDRTKAIFGVVLLGVAIWMSQRVMSEQISLLLWAFLIISSAIYLGALEPLSSKNGWAKLLKSFAIILFIYGIMLFIGSFNGGSLTNPIKSLHANHQASYNEDELRFENVKNVQQIDEVVKNSSKIVMLDFSAVWCVACKEFEDITFVDEKVKQKMKNFTLIRADVTQNTDEDKAMLDKYGLFGPPGIIFYKNNKELKHLEVVGFKNPEEFLKILQKVEEY